MALALTAGWLAPPAQAQKINCSNEHRSGKLYFDQYAKAKAQNRTDEAMSLVAKAVATFGLAVELCPDKPDYHWRYSLALAEQANMYLGQIPFSTGGSDTLLAGAVEKFALVGEHFEAVKDVKDGLKGKNRKAVRENRGHYWVDHYNEGLDYMSDEDFESAALHFKICRLINPHDPRAYLQEAVSLISADRREEALALVQTERMFETEDWTGYEYKIEASSERFATVQRNIFRERARFLAEKADEENDLDKLDRAISDYDQLLEWTPGDANLLFERGLVKLTGGAVVTLTDSTAGATMYSEAAVDFRAAADVVPADGENAQFHADCVFNELQAYVNAANEPKALEVNLEYVCIQSTDPAGWQFLAAALIGGGDSAGAVAALMMSRSLAGSEVPVEAAVGNATADDKAAVTELGDPGLVMTYQEQSSGNQITTWLWPEKKLARHYILGTFISEVTWCQ